MYGHHRPESLLALRASWAATEAPEVQERSGDAWGNYAPILVTEGEARFPLDVPDGVSVFPLVSSSSDGHTFAAKWDADERAVLVRGATHGAFVLVVHLVQ